MSGGTPAPQPAGLGPRTAVALVAGSSAAVLVVELVALRLLAPFLGLTLETNTLVIGTALAAIALGSWAGGRAADVVPPRPLLAPLLLVSGLVVAVTPVLVRAAGATGDPGLLVLAAGATIVVPGALLSAVTPLVTKLRLRSLEETGTVVGRLSGVGTVGAIAGTVLTGFVLVSRVPVSGILVGLGALLVLAALAVATTGRRRGTTAAGAVVLGLGALGAWAGPGGCDVETTYHCASVVADADRPGGRSLWLDSLQHSYVDLDDPTHLELTYVRGLAAGLDAALPGEAAVRGYHLGGGGLTLPRWLAATRPGSTAVVSEIDGGVLALDESRLGLRTGPDLEVRVEDGRLGLARLDDGSVDVVVGDAFGGVSVPWHLTTREAVAEVHRVLDDGGVYLANVIDHPPLGFARAEVATLRERFAHVAVAGPVGAFDPDGPAEGGNLALLASDRAVDVAAWQEHLAERDVAWVVRADGELDTWLHGADALTDDHAPVDQLLTPYPSGR